MNKGAQNLEAGFAWVALYADNDDSEYTVSTAVKLYPSRLRENTGTIRVSTLNLPDLNTNYKAVMAIANSDPLRIVGVSEAIDVLPNSAAVVTDKSRYVAGTLIYVSYTMSSTADSLETGFAWVGLFPLNVQNYSAVPLTRSQSSLSENAGTVAISTMNLPSLNTTYKAVMAITDSKPVRILGISQPFLVVPPKWRPPGMLIDNCLTLGCCD
jgi:hypothetical protein